MRIGSKLPTWEAWTDPSEPKERTHLLQDSTNGFESCWHFGECIVVLVSTKTGEKKLLWKATKNAPVEVAKPPNARRTWWIALLFNWGSKKNYTSIFNPLLSSEPWNGPVFSEKVTYFYRMFCMFYCQNELLDKSGKIHGKWAVYGIFLTSIHLCFVLLKKKTDFCIRQIRKERRVFNPDTHTHTF